MNTDQSMCLLVWDFNGYTGYEAEQLPRVAVHSGQRQKTQYTKIKMNEKGGLERSYTDMK